MACNLPEGLENWSYFFESITRDGVKKKFTIKLISDRERDACVMMMRNHFVYDEPLNHKFHVRDDDVSIAEMCSNWDALITHGISLGCYEISTTNVEPILTGVCVNLIKCKDDPVDNIDDLNGVSIKKVFKILSKIEEKYNIFNEMKVTRYLAESGLIVRPEYRGLRIGVHFLNCRKQLCHILGIQATVMIFTAVSSIKTGENSGYELLAELTDTELSDLDAEGHTVKMMGKKYDI